MTYAQRCRRVALLIRLRDILESAPARDTSARTRRKQIKQQRSLWLKEVA